MKRFTCILLSLLVFASVCGTVLVGAEQSSADEQLKDSVAVITSGESTLEAEVGEVIEYKAYLTLPGIIDCISGDISFNSTVLELVDEETPVRFPTFSWQVISILDYDKLYFNTGTPYEFDFSDGKIIAELKFRVIAAGSSQISFALNQASDPGNTEYADGYEILYPGVYWVEQISVVQTETTVPEASTTAPVELDYEIGDVNRDSKLNIRDATLIQKYAAKLADFDEIQLVLADFNGNSTVNVKDATAIQKFIAGLI